jgi:acyl-CoA reductase-like NAD-dependent aldehyde dehydrogenase
VVRLRRYARGALEPREIPLAPAPNPGGGPSSTGGGLVNAMAVRLPVGVVVCITSYNVPMTNVMGKIGPALAMGNTVVIKPAHQDPLGIIKMVEAFHDAGFPEGVVNLVVRSTPESAEALVAAPQTDMISFTGSACCSSSAARAPAWCSRMPTSTPPPRARRARLPSTPARSARRPLG